MDHPCHLCANPSVLQYFDCLLTAHFLFKVFETFGLPYCIGCRRSVKYITCIDLSVCGNKHHPEEHLRSLGGVFANAVHSYSNILVAALKFLIAINRLVH